MKVLLSCIIVSLAFCSCAEQKPNASVSLRITSRLPIAPQEGCSGIFTVKNTGGVTFKVVTDKEWSSVTTRFYRGGDETEQRLEDEHWRGRQRREQERAEVASDYYFCIGQNKETKTLQPSESISFECKSFYFTCSFSSPYSEMYKAEMYLGKETWVPVAISPAIGFIRHVDLTESGKDNVLVYAREGTNQFLYLKTGEKFKRVAEMKLGVKPKYKEGVVSFISPDGSTNEITRTDALKIIKKREKE